MISKGIITSIDYNGNTCEVRIPVFESAASDTEVCLPAQISMTPGLYNNFKEGDVVYVAFENNQYESPIVLGKLYLGADEERKDPRGALNCDTVNSVSPISIPIDTKLTLNNDPSNLTTVGVQNDLSCYKSIADIAKGLQKQEEQIGSINAEIIDTGDGLGARVKKLEQDDARHEAELILHADEIDARVTKTQNGEVNGFGWNLQEDKWRVFQVLPDGDDEGTAPDEKDILVADRDGLTVTGTVNADAGNIAGWTIEKNKLTAGTDSGYVAFQSNGGEASNTYVKAEYITATGAQWINTGVVPSTTLVTEITLVPDENYLSENAIFGSTWATNGYFLMFYNTNNTDVIRFHSRNYICDVDTFNKTGKNIIKTYSKSLTDNILEVNGIAYQYTTAGTETADSTSNILIGSTADNHNHNGHFKIYGYRMWQNGNLIRNYIPAYKQGKYGLFDLCSNTFKASESGTDFAGAVADDNNNFINRNGVLYQRLNYIESNGTQTIDTGITAINNCFIIDLQFTNNTSGDAGRQLMGLSGTASAYWGNNAGTWEKIGNDYHYDTLDRVLVHFDIGNITTERTTAWLGDSASKYTGTDSEWATYTNSSLKLCSLTTGASTNYYCAMKLYGYKVYNADGILTHSVIPVKIAKSSTSANIGKIGLLDLITSSFVVVDSTFLYGEYEYTGGEVFTNGNDTYRTLQYLESHGQEYIDTGNTVYVSSEAAYDIDRAEIIFAYTEVNNTGTNQYDSIYGVNSNMQLGRMPNGLFTDGKTSTTTTTLNLNTKYTYKADYLTGKSYINNEEVDNRTLNGSGNAYLFASYSAGNASYKSKARLYDCLLYKNNILIHHFVPVLKNEIEYGLYDFITQTFYSNSSNTGAFTGLGYSYEFNSIYLGSDVETEAPFRVTNTGKLFASEANITGTVNAIDGNFTGNINATSGNIGGFEIQGNSLFADGENGSVSLSADGITVGDIFNINPDGSASFKGNLAANSLLIGDVNDITKQLPLWASDVSNTSAVEYFNIDEYEYSSTGTFWQPWKVKFTVSSYSDREHTIPVSVASNRTITATLKFEYTTPMGGTRFTTRTEIIVLTPSSSGGSTYESDWKEYDLGVYWVTGFTISIEPQEYNANKGNFKNINGFFVDKYGCCTKQFLFDFKNINVDTGLPRNTSFNLRGYTGTGTDSYKTCFFNLSYFLNNNDYTKFQRVYGFNLQLISRHTNNSGYAVDANTADSVSEIHAWAERGSIAVFCGVDALSSDSLGIGYFVPNDTSSIFATNVVVAGWGAELYNGHGREVDFKEHYDRANSMFTGLVLTVYGIPK